MTVPVIKVPTPALEILVVPPSERSPDVIAMFPVSAVRESTVTASWISTFPAALIVRVAPSAVIESPFAAIAPENV